MARGPANLVKVTTVLALAAALVSACSGGGSERVSADSPIVVEVSQNLVTFQNRTGLPLADVTISIVPYGPGEFTRRLSRIENTAKREVSVSEFRGRDGTPLNLRVTRPKSVKVHAEDQTGKAYDVEVPWK